MWRTLCDRSRRRVNRIKEIKGARVALNLPSIKKSRRLRTPGMQWLLFWRTGVSECYTNHVLRKTLVPPKIASRKNLAKQGEMPTRDVRKPLMRLGKMAVVTMARVRANTLQLLSRLRSGDGQVYRE